MDKRTPLRADSKIMLGDTEYTIINLVGYGSNAFVYRACYADNIHREKTHTILIKELFPYHQQGLIFRGDTGRIAVDEAAVEYFEMHRKSFLRGNVTHLDFQNANAEQANLNINSYEANNTLYTILAHEGGETLRSVTERGEIKNSLHDITVCMLNILDTLDSFHDNNLLHLDICPDNILLMPLKKGRSEKYRRIILVDYNSVWTQNNVESNTNVSKKENYSAPELRLNDTNAICPATDLFSVCAIFLEYLQGQSLDFNKLCSTRNTVQNKIILFDNAPKAVVQKALRIIHKGLKLPPNRRYQTAGELKKDFIVLLKLIEKRRNAARIRKIAIPVAIIMLVCTAAIGGAVIINQMGYPRTQREISLNTTAMNGILTVIAGLDMQIRNEKHVLKNLLSLSPDAAQVKIQETLERNDSMKYGGIDSGLFANTPLDIELLEAIYRQPENHNVWQKDMLTRFSTMLDEDSIYTERHKKEAVENYLAYLDSYETLVFVQIYTLLLPLNERGKRGVLTALRDSTEIGRAYATFTPPENTVDLDNILKRLENDVNAYDRKLDLIRLQK